MIEIRPIDGPGMEKMVNGLYEIEPAVLSRVNRYSNQSRTISSRR